MRARTLSFPSSPPSPRIPRRLKRSSSSTASAGAEATDLATRSPSPRLQTIVSSEDSVCGSETWTKGASRPGTGCFRGLDVRGVPHMHCAPRADGRSPSLACRASSSMPSRGTRLRSGRRRVPDSSVKGCCEAGRRWRESAATCTCTPCSIRICLDRRALRPPQRESFSSPARPRGGRLGSPARRARSRRCPPMPLIRRARR